MLATKLDGVLKVSYNVYLLVSVYLTHSAGCKGEVVVYSLGFSTYMYIFDIYSISYLVTQASCMSLNSEKKLSTIMRWVCGIRST